jgi:hypothetical protein
VTVCLSDPDVPVTVIVYVPAAVPGCPVRDVVCRVTVTVLPGVCDVGESEQVVFDGAPAQLKLTDELYVPSAPTVTV